MMDSKLPAPIFLLSTLIYANIGLAQSLTLEEVVVTATKRAENLQDVAVAVSAVPDWVLDRNQIVRTEELTTLVPSLTLQDGGNARESSMNIRGIGTQSFSTAAEPSISTVVDGVVMGRSGLAFAQLADVQRVEVLRGPQGTLFGKNASGGVIHIITKDPADSFEADISGIAAQQDEYRLAGSISSPITDDLGFRLTASYIDDGGYIKNFYDGKYYNGKEDSLVRGKLRWQATDTFAIKYTGDWQETDCNCTVAPIRQVDPDPALLAELYPVVPSETNDEVNLDESTSRNTSSSGHTIDMNWDIGNFSLTSITAYRSWEISGRADIDARPTKPLGLDQEGATDQDQFSQELRVTSPADGFITYVAGLYYFQQSVDRTFTRSVAGTGLQSDFSVDTVNYAAFGEATFNLSDRWRLITGLRYTNDQLDYKFGRTGQLGGTLPVVPPVEDGTDADDLSGKLALQWDFADTAMTYLSYTQGYKGPAYSIAVGTDPTNLQPVDPETSDSIELGLKSSLWNNRMTLNLAAFYTRYSDWQAEAFVDDGSGEGTGAFELANAGKVLTRGIELDVTALPITNLTLYGGLALIRATIDEFDEGPCSFGQIDRGECPNDVQDLSGGDMPYSPDLRVILTANYFQPLKSLPFGLTYNGTYRWQDEVLFSVTQDEFTEQEAYGILDLSFGIRDDNEHYAITAFVKNATDNFYVDNIASIPSILLPGGYVQNVPKFARRTFGIELEYHWF